ncbi:hypothetical protein NHX12_011933 [Muraenolepis orangiensis]|uniref:Peptidase metallopeptidase domain-containing protein n=1 Tax=Muraenolepis orangiensis TaxID=630683 RepID=A0A9Q0I7P7_9TELE|nr:hypothetical protein NHX12_011933 [Muraenolepis orangiensis]
MTFRSVLILCLLSECPKTTSANGGGPSLTIPKHDLSTHPPASVAPMKDDSSELVDWLMRYGYLPPPDPSTGQLQAWTAVTHAVRAMQKFAGLQETGLVDEETIALMKNINWRLRSYPYSSGLSRETVAGPDGADLQVDFLQGYHGDGYPFDGPGGAVGHAFFPSDPSRAGGVHLDAEEEWSFRKPASEGTDLFTVLVHEFGHTLGLAHSSARQSVMRPYYQGPAGDPLHYRLGPHDLEHITQLYGKRNEQLTTDARRLTPEPHMRHRGPHRHSFDAVARLRGETFFFKGQSMWRVSSEGLVSGRGASIRRLWAGLPPDLLQLHAVLERKSDHGIIFISGSRFWLFQDLSLQEGYPRPLSDLSLEASGWGGPLG